MKDIFPAETQSSNIINARRFITLSSTETAFQAERGHPDFIAFTSWISIDNSGVMFHARARQVYIPTKEDFTYLCTVEDLYSRKIVGWATGCKIDAELALKAFVQAVVLRRSLQGLILHSDRGSQFASAQFREGLRRCGFVQSMSRKGNCYDNAPMESFFRSFKVEEAYRRDYATHEEASRGVTDYIERFYNQTRLHSSLGYRSSAELERLRHWELQCRTWFLRHREHSSLEKR